MDKVFPPEFRQLAKRPTTKAALFSEIAPIGPLDCRNCGGNGKMAIFIAIEGPFESPGCNPYGEKSIKFDGECYNGRGGYWLGNTFTFDCPVCHGTGKKQ